MVSVNMLPGDGANGREPLLGKGCSGLKKYRGECCRRRFRPRGATQKRVRAGVGNRGEVRPESVGISQIQLAPGLSWSRLRFASAGNSRIHTATTTSVPTPPSSTAPTGSSHAAVTPDSNSPS